MFDRFFFHRHLDEDEEILMVVHKHWIIGLRVLVLPTLIFLLILSVLFVVQIPLAIYGVLIACFGAAIWWVRNFMDYYLDAWIVTNTGVIDLEWHGWFHRTSARVLYSDVQGVGYEICGILGTLLRYGQMSLEKISTGSTMTMPFVKHPRVVESKILGAMEAYMLKKNLKDATTVKSILAEFVASTLQKQSASDAAKHRTR